MIESVQTRLKLDGDILVPQTWWEKLWATLVGKKSGLHSSNNHNSNMFLYFCNKSTLVTVGIMLFSYHMVQVSKDLITWCSHFATKEMW